MNDLLDRVIYTKDKEFIKNILFEGNKMYNFDEEEIKLLESSL